MCRLELGFQPWTNMQESSGKPTTPYTASAINYNVWGTPVEYPSWEYSFDIQDSQGN